MGENCTKKEEENVKGGRKETIREKIKGKIEIKKTRRKEKRMRVLMIGA